MRYIIIGGGGFGLELFTYLAADILSGRLPAATRLGVLDDGPDCEVLHRIPDASYLGPLDAYTPEGDDEGLIAIGSPSNRRRIASIAIARGLRLGKYVHSTAWVAPNARLGNGVILCPYVIVSAFAEIGNNVAVNVHGGVGHGANVGEHTVMGPYSVINGDCALGEGCLLGSRATLFPKVRLGRGCSVDAHTTVRRSAGDFKILSTKRQDQIVDDRIAARNFE
jgi:carbonic anhydrase/acetyltransferase-like protein (isoleucine patch superfamily)